MRLVKRFLPLAIVGAFVISVAAQDESAVSPQHVGRVQDWSYNHIVFSGGLKGADLRAATKAEPRILFHLLERNLDGAETPVGPRLPPRVPQGGVDGGNQNPRKDVHIDWSITLGTGVVPQNMYPAKFNFDVAGAPDCVRDFVVYGLNVAGALNGQANLVGLNRLYSGTGASFCNAATPKVNWAYNGTTVAGGAVLTSPVVSLNGTKIAYVESVATRTIFHILTWKAGEGTAATTAANPTANGACTAASSCLKSLTLSATATDTFSSPWVDFATDKGFVGSDDGKIYRINCALNTNPTIDWTFTLPVAGTGGATPRPNGPVYNSPYGYLFVGDQLGEMWTIKAKTGVPSLLAGPVMIGGGGCTTTNPPGRTGTPAPCTPLLGGFGMVDSVILDARGASQRIFAFSGNDGTVGSAAVVAQLKQDLTGLIRVHVGLGGVNIHTGAFDNNYWGATPKTGKLFMCGMGAADTTPYHYWISFTNYPKINSTPTGSLQRIATAGIQCVPATEFYNPNINLGGVAGHHDLLMSGLVDATNGYIITNDISLGSVTAGLNSVNYPGGISGIIIDNASTQLQASSLYFSTLTTVNVGTCTNLRCAVKLTQLNLQ